MTAGALNCRAAFERRVPGDDGAGNTLTDSWASVVTVWARFQPAFGREALEAGRLESTARGTVTVRRSTATIGILASDRVRFTAGPQSGLTMQIRSITRTADNAHLQMTVESGVAM